MNEKRLRKLNAEAMEAIAAIEASGLPLLPSTVEAIARARASSAELAEALSDPRWPDIPVKDGLTIEPESDLKSWARNGKWPS